MKKIAIKITVLLFAGFFTLCASAQTATTTATTSDNNNNTKTITTRQSAVAILEANKTQNAASTSKVADARTTTGTNNAQATTATPNCKQSDSKSTLGCCAKKCSSTGGKCKLPNMKNVTKTTCDMKKTEAPKQ